MRRSSVLRHARRTAVLCAAALLAVLPATGTAAGSQAAPVHGIGNFPMALLASLATPDAAPPGADDWNCRPTAAHPRPVVLLHGTLENAFANWNRLAPALKNAGYCVFAPNYGALPGEPFKGTGDIAVSAQEIAAYVDRVLAATGARQVDLVGHSQGGGVMPRQYLRFAGGADAADPTRNKVGRLVGITPSNHGTAVGNLGAPLVGILGPLVDPVLLPGLDGPWAEQQSVGSAFNKRLDAGGDTEPGVEYTVIASRADEVLVPFTNSFLTAGPGATVHNIVLQDVCPTDLSDHLDASYDPVVVRLTLNALDPAQAVPPHCNLLTLPVVGGLLL
ncbi:esterase/lipase family protein [Yinghuangia soli]|uniref:Alpha/beta fold hydrolase n=1 Tax=Yinghuangia soli TaxID=2908204 RepID=A0AA41PTZ6_9ACTN|nr:alpha/beta fold hydrolase [Yinghuangia soli]MCF2525693.1 alpha/beta fold hydrolase [Yinghuangia soli]